MTYILLIIWFIFLIKWADILVEWAWSIAKKFGISNLVIGLTIVAFWTSAPEFVVSFISSLKGNSQMAISNVIGSNIVNVLFILWVTALISNIAIPKSTFNKEIPFWIFVSILLFVLITFSTFSLWKINWMWIVDWIILLCFFWAFLYYTYKISKNWSDEEDDLEILPQWKSIIFIILWLAWLIYWWQLIVDNAVKIAQSFWISDAFIGLTIVAVWTSLPELASSIMAALKKKTDMAVWAIIWSNIFNILWILWFSSLFANLDWYKWINIDLVVMILWLVLILVLPLIKRKLVIWKVDWLILIWVYFWYITYLITNL